MDLLFPSKLGQFFSFFLFLCFFGVVFHLNRLGAPVFPQHRYLQSLKIEPFLFPCFDSDSLCADWISFPPGLAELAFSFSAPDKSQINPDSLGIHLP